MKKDKIETVLFYKWWIRENGGDPTVKTHYINGVLTSQDKFIWVILSSSSTLLRTTRSILSISWTHEMKSINQLQINEKTKL